MKKKLTTKKERPTKRKYSISLGRRIFRGIVIWLGFLLVIAAFLLGIFVYQNTAPSGKVRAADGISLDADGSVILELRHGETADGVGRRLEEAGLIRSRFAWYVLSRVQKEPIKSGSYRLEPPLGLLHIHKILVTGKQLLYRVTVPEGLTLKKTARIFEEQGICTYDDFLAAAGNQGILNHYEIPARTMEGYLFPDTYLFPVNYPAYKVVYTMADTFFRRLLEIEPEAIALSPAALHEKVILASIVEREYRKPSEAPLMAGVFYNRLNIKMALQSCATVEYVITEIQGRPHPEVLYTRDTEINDPYNTYVLRGLPPGPISSPGAVALDAAFHPAKSDYLYFRLTEPQQGTHYFSRTLDDHIQAGALYLKPNR